MVGSWATAHPPALGHNTMVCIVTSMDGCTENGPRHGRARPRHDRAMLRHSRDEGCDTVGNTRVRGLAGGVCRDTKFCIVTGARDWSLGVVSRYSLCIVTGGQSS